MLHILKTQIWSSILDPLLFLFPKWEQKVKIQKDNYPDTAFKNLKPSIMYLLLASSASPATNFLLNPYAPVTPQHLHVLKEVKWLAQVHTLATPV